MTSPYLTAEAEAKRVALRQAKADELLRQRLAYEAKVYQALTGAFYKSRVGMTQSELDELG